MELFLNHTYATVKGIGIAYLEYHFPFLQGLHAAHQLGY